MIRAAKEKDIDRILQLLYLVNDIHAELFPHFFKAEKTKYNKEQLKNIISKVDSKTILVYTNNNDETLGYLIYEDYSIICTENMYPTKILYIDDICVNPEHQREKIATSLYKYLKNFAYKNGYNRITANIWQNNNASRQFFENLNLKPVKTMYEEIL